MPLARPYPGRPRAHPGQADRTPSAPHGQLAGPGSRRPHRHVSVRSISVGLDAARVAARTGGRGNATSRRPAATIAATPAIIPHWTASRSRRSAIASWSTMATTPPSTRTSHSGVGTDGRSLSAQPLLPTRPVSIAGLRAGPPGSPSRARAEARSSRSREQRRGRPRSRLVPPDGVAVRRRPSPATPALTTARP